MFCIYYITLSSIINYLYSVCHKFLFGSKPKSLRTSTGTVSFAMIWLSHPCIWKTNFWYRMAFTLTLIMICGLNALNVSMHTMSNALKNQMSGRTMNVFVHLCHVNSNSKSMFVSLPTYSVSLLFFLFHCFLFRMGQCGNKQPPEHHLTLKQKNAHN